MVNPSINWVLEQNKNPVIKRFLNEYSDNPLTLFSLKGELE